MAERKVVSFTLNGKKKKVVCGPDEMLINVLRRRGCKGVKRGCDEGVCGACTVIMDGRAVYSCILRAFQAEGAVIRTIEGLGDFDKPHPFQEALVEEAGIQCGYCTPGMVLSYKAMIDADPKPSDAKIKEHMDGNLCRCTGYEKIRRAIDKATAGEGSNG